MVWALFTELESQCRSRDVADEWLRVVEFLRLLTSYSVFDETLQR